MNPTAVTTSSKICTWDRAGLFSKIAGSFSAVGLNILSAQIFTRSDGVVLDKFFVNDAKTGNLAPRERQDKFTALLGKVLNNEGLDLAALIAREINSQPAYQAYAGERLATQIYFDNGASDTRTLVEIETEDRLGLLYVISQTFTELALDISARASSPNAARPLILFTCMNSAVARSLRRNGKL